MIDYKLMSRVFDAIPPTMPIEETVPINVKKNNVVKDVQQSASNLNWVNVLCVKV